MMLLAAAGCGSSGNPVKAPPLAAPYVPAPGPGSSFVASPLMASPDDGFQVYSTAQTTAGRRQKALPANREATTSAATTPAATASSSVLNHWFYLVNGEGASSAATGATPPNVLTVTGSAPYGAPGPNGGTGVSVAPLSSIANPTGNQLWKAVAATDGYYYLRSAESFKVNDTLPSALTGFGASGAPLDLGYLSTFNTSIYFNFNGSQPVNTNFQKWAYDVNNAELTNGSTLGQLYNTQPTAGVGTGTSAPSNQWYAYPNYAMEGIVGEPNSSPPFPDYDTPGELAAYEYMSYVFLVGQTVPPCTYEGTQYDGIRCEYINLSASATLQTCAGDSSLWASGAASTIPGTSTGNPGQYQGTTISATDWATVTTQLYQECAYAVDVQATFSNYNDIISYVFSSSSNAISSLAIDVGLSDSQSLNVVPTEIIEGLLYTMLSATGDPGVGAAANLMETGVNAAVAADSSSSLTKPLATTVGTLYSDLTAQFSALTTQTSNGENKILEDWGRLSQIGPLTEITGYNGLGINTSQVQAIETQALKGYELSVMQQLMPASSFGMLVSVGLPAGTEGAPYAWDQYAYPTFGSDTLDSNIFSEVSLLRGGSYPSQTVMQTDIADNGANLFDFFNGLNGWASLPFGPNSGCDSMVTTLFNDTPVELWVTVTPDKGGLVSPGNAYPGSGNSGKFELTPYGYLPIFTVPDGSGENALDMNVTIFDSYSEANTVQSFTFASDGCAAGQLSVSNYTPTNSYVLEFVGEPPSGSRPQGLWATVLNLGDL